MLKKLFLLLCCAFCFGMEKPRQLPNEAKSSGLVKLVHSMRYRVKADKIDDFLLGKEAETISASEFNLIAMPPVGSKNWELYEKFWYHWGQYFLHHARINTPEYSSDEPGCKKKLLEITQIIHSDMNLSTLAQAAAGWRYTLAHQPIVVSIDRLKDFLEELKTIRGNGDGTRMAHLLVEEFAAEQERVRLQWVAYIRSRKTLGPSIMRLAKACALRWEQSFANDREIMAEIRTRVKNLEAVLTDNDRGELIQARAKRHFLE